MIDCIKQYTDKYCRSKLELDKEIMQGMAEASEALSRIDGIDITTQPITFDCRDFNTPTGFSCALFMAAERFKGNEDDIVVRYAKPENKKTGNVYVQFHILKEVKKDDMIK